MKVSRLKIENFRGIEKAQFFFDGHTLLIGDNNVGKSTICEALELALGPERLNRFPAVDEYDFYNARYLSDDGEPVPAKIEVVLTELTDEVQRTCNANTEFWHETEARILESGEIDNVDSEDVSPCLRVVAIAEYDKEEDEFLANSYYAHSPNEEDGALTRIKKNVKRSFGFLYLRTLRTGSRALSLERGSLLDIILKIKGVRTGLWEESRSRLKELSPPISDGADELEQVLKSIENRLAEYIAVDANEKTTSLFVSQLTREHLRKTMSFFLALGENQEPVPFQKAGTGTLNTLVLALLSFIAEIKEDNIIFAMEEPEIALPPHTQRRITNYLLTKTNQCFVTSHSPYVIERFKPERIKRLVKVSEGCPEAQSLPLEGNLKKKTFRKHLRRAIAEAMLGRGVIVLEGITEQLAFAVAAEKVEEADSNLLPLDLAGVSIITADGDGSISEFGAFFQALGLKTFSFYDKKSRKDTEVADIASSFDLHVESSASGFEKLMVAETTESLQWKFLEYLRDNWTGNNFGIPGTKPNLDSEIRELTERILKSDKGAGICAEFMSFCAVDELPKSVVDFLKKVYPNFPKPVSEQQLDSPAAPAENSQTETEQLPNDESGNM